jgi:hypothetical protein
MKLPPALNFSTHQQTEPTLPKKNVNDLITDQEMDYARRILSGTMTDRRAAEAAGLDPNSAAYIKSKPRVRAYMLEHRAAVEQKLVEQEAQELRRSSLVRDRVLARLWQIADMEPDKTRNSASSQVKALSMIIAIEGLIPTRTPNGRRAVAAENQPAPPPAHPPFYVSAWARTRQNGETANPDPSPDPAKEEAVTEVQSAPGKANDPLPTELPSSSRPVVEGPVVGGPAVPGPVETSQTTSSVPRVPMADYFAPDTRRPFSRDNRFGRRR